MSSINRARARQLLSGVISDAKLGINFEMCKRICQNRGHAKILTQPHRTFNYEVDPLGLISSEISSGQFVGYRTNCSLQFDILAFPCIGLSCGISAHQGWVYTGSFRNL